MKIIHFVTDEKFIDGAIDLFESDKRVDNYYIKIQRHSRMFTYIKNKNVEQIPQSKILDRIKNCEVIILHSLPAIPVQLITKIPHSIKIIWFAWGFDLYKDFYAKIIPIKLYGDLTSVYLKQNKFFSSFKYNLWFLKQTLLHKIYLNKVLSRIDYFSGVFPYEYNEIRKAHPDFKAEPLDFYYGSTNFFIPEIPELKIKHSKLNVIIGNSGDATNNHLDVLQLLKKNNCTIEGLVIIPLSYGCDNKYADKVYNFANDIYPNKVNALRQFMPLNEYLDLISNCRIAIYAHKRQQASDNIFLQLMYGAKVYMSEDSLAFHYLKRIGLKIFSLERDLSSFKEDISDEDILINRQILSSRYSTSKLLDRVKKINDILIGVSKR